MGIKNEPYLSSMLSKNLYSPKNIYNIDKNILAKSIDAIVQAISNGSANTQNTLLERVLTKDNKMTHDATVQLSKMFLERVNQNLIREFVPSVDFKYDGIDIVKPLNYWKITKSNDIDTVSKLLQVIKGTVNLDPNIPSLESFNYDYEKHNNYLYKSLGEGQKRELITSVTKNKYNPIEGLKYGSNPEDMFIGGGFDYSIKDNYDVKTLTTKLSDGKSYDANDVGAWMSPKTKAYTILKQDGKTKLISKGSAVTTNDNSDDFIRVFTKDYQYDSFDKVMKYDAGRLGENSVLQKVIPRIFPKHDDDYKNLMFSITNLAQNNNKVMWFAPYNLTINESSGASWDKKNFIGRNEPVYSYVGSERKATIGFTLISDYPDELNNLKKWGDVSNNTFDKFFRQDNPVDEPTKDNSLKIAIENNENKPKDKEVIKDYGFNKFTSSSDLKYYFDNDNTELKEADDLLNDTPQKLGAKGIKKFFQNLPELIDFLNSEYGAYYRVIFDGHASSAHYENYNTILSYNRSYNVYSYLMTRINDKSEPLEKFTGTLNSETTTIPSKYLKNNRFTIRARGESDADKTVTNVKSAMKDRFVAMYLELDPNRIPTDKEIYSDDSIKNIDKQDNKSNINSSGEYYFQDIPKSYKSGNIANFEDVEKSLVKGYAESIKYFSPIFHSQTAINLNERCSFLQQCTRQGNTYMRGTDSNSSINASDNIGNSIFGKPPVCILRLGDFFHTKILVENIEFSYDPLIWDVNPEGIGMQPMLCNVTMSVIIIGGSSLEAPVNELQNALGRNFYANTKFYDK